MIEYRHYESEKTAVVTTECALCGTPIRDQQGIHDHLPSWPAREIYAERGALRDDAPDPERVRAAIATYKRYSRSHSNHETSFTFRTDSTRLCGPHSHTVDMATRKTTPTDSQTPIDRGVTPVELAERPDGTWEATQPGLEVVGTGPSAARATENMAARIAELTEAGEL